MSGTTAKRKRREKRRALAQRREQGMDDLSRDMVKLARCAGIEQRFAVVTPEQVAADLGISNQRARRDLRALCSGPNPLFHEGRTSDDRPVYWFAGEPQPLCVERVVRGPRLDGAS